MTKDEALLMIEKAELTGNLNDLVLACDACKEALEQPTTQEPVAYYKEWEDKSGKHKDIKFEQTEGYSPLFTHPKEWQGLTNDEIWDIANFLGKNKEWDYPVMFAKTIEKVLREKNT